MGHGINWQVFMMKQFQWTLDLLFIIRWEHCLVLGVKVSGTWFQALWEEPLLFSPRVRRRSSLTGAIPPSGKKCPVLIRFGISSHKRILKALKSSQIRHPPRFVIYLLELFALFGLVCAEWRRNVNSFAPKKWTSHFVWFVCGYFVQFFNVWSTNESLGFDRLCPPPPPTVGGSAAALTIFFSWLSPLHH